MFTCSDSILISVLAIGIIGLIMNIWTCWRSKVMWKYLKLLAILIKRWYNLSNTNCHTYIKLTAATTAPCWWYPKINQVFSPTSILFLLLPVTFQPYLIFETQYYQNCHTAKAPSIPEHIYLQKWSKMLLNLGKYLCKPYLHQILLNLFFR